jgi:hypothetical protein
VEIWKSHHKARRSSIIRARIRRATRWAPIITICSVAITVWWHSRPGQNEPDLIPLPNGFDGARASQTSSCPCQKSGSLRKVHPERKTWPSFRSSPWMRGAPQSGFARLIFRMRSRASRDTSGLPGLCCLLFQVQYSRNPRRCQAMTVSG